MRLHGESLIFYHFLGRSCWKIIPVIFSTLENQRLELEPPKWMWMEDDFPWKQIRQFFQVAVNFLGCKEIWRDPGFYHSTFYGCCTFENGGCCWMIAHDWNMIVFFTWRIIPVLLGQWLNFKLIGMTNI